MKKALVTVLSLFFAFSVLTGCANVGKYYLPHYDQSADDVLNSDLFYRNDMVTSGADPTVIYIDDETDEENYGWFFLYSTSDDFGCLGFSTYRSKDMVNWEYMGPIFAPEEGSWSRISLWAPECIYDESTDKYYLFYSAQDLHGDSKYFDTHEERTLYHEIEAEVNTYGYAAVEEKINEAKLTYSEAETYEGLTEEQLKKVKNSIANYYSNKEALDENDNLTEEEKQQSLCEYGRERLLEIYTVKIHYTHANNGYSLGVAVSDSPAGPFVQYTNIEGQAGYDAANRTLDLGSPFITHEDLYTSAAAKEGYHDVFIPIDIHPYVDPVSGKKYFYFANTYGGNSIYGVEAGENWTDDPKWETLTYLIRPGYKNVTGNEKTDYGDSGVNEGPFMHYDEASKTYFLTFSINGYPDKLYAVAQATATSPLGTFTKVDRQDGGIILSSEPAWDHVSGTGHHSLVEYDGKLYIMYHAHYDRVYGGSLRGMCVDEIKFFTRPDGQKLMIANGPTYAPMPKIGPDAEYKNIAESATVKATNAAEGSDASALNDGLLSITTYHDFIPEYLTEKGTTKITLTFDDYRAIRAIMVFNSKYLETAFGSIDRIELDYKLTDENGAEQTGTAYMEDVLFDMEKYTTQWEDEENFARPGGSVTVEFDELMVKEIRITIKAKNPVAVSEIFVLGK